MAENSAFVTGFFRGRAVQVDPIKPTLKALGTKFFELQYDELLSSCAFTLNLCRYTAASLRRRRSRS
jgi:hypothetical protein